MGAVTVMVPVAKVQVGCVRLNVGAGGGALGSLSTAAVFAELQLELFFTCTV